MLGIHFKANVGLRQRIALHLQRNVLKNHIDPNFEV
jgi:hypothetical protein